jgi:membrane protein
LLARHDAGIAQALSIGKTVIKAESHATRAAAVTIVEAGRRAGAADRYVRRHPWESMLIAASTAMALVAFARRRSASNDAETPLSDHASR